VWFHAVGLPATPKQNMLREAVFLLNVSTQQPQVVAAFVCLVALAASTLTCFGVYMCQWCAAQRRRRENALAVRIAENAPQTAGDDWEEHEIEKQLEVRRAAPSDSEDEEAEGVVGK
jgi:hypothetical protein